MRRLVVVALVLLSLGLVGIGFLPLLRQPVQGKELPARVDTAGTDLPQEGALVENGHLIRDYADANLLQVYSRLQPFLGEPITGYDGRCQTFRFGRLCYTPTKPDEWKVELANLGTQDLQIEGYSPKPNAQLHPAVRDYLISQGDVGVDTVRVFGRAITEARCERRTRECVQWLEKARLAFPIDAVTGDQVRREPLGLWLMYPASRASAMIVTGAISTPAPSANLPLILVGVGLIGAVILFTRGASSGRAGGAL